MAQEGQSTLVTSQAQGMHRYREVRAVALGARGKGGQSKSKRTLSPLSHCTGFSWAWSLSWRELGNVNQIKGENQWSPQPGHSDCHTETQKRKEDILFDPNVAEVTDVIFTRGQGEIQGT